MTLRVFLGILDLLSSRFPILFTQKVTLTLTPPLPPWLVTSYVNGPYTVKDVEGGNKAMQDATKTASGRKE